MPEPVTGMAVGLDELVTVYLAGFSTITDKDMHIGLAWSMVNIATGVVYDVEGFCECMEYNVANRSRPELVK